MSNVLRTWKKVYLSDIESVSLEIKEVIQKPAIVIVTGEMGVGKTTLIKEIIGKDAASPTYSLIAEHGFFLHADFYRIEKVEEIIHLELNLVLQGKHLAFIEWGEKFIDRIRFEMPEEFLLYQLIISINESIANTEQALPARNFILKQLRLT